MREKIMKLDRIYNTSIRFQDPFNLVLMEHLINRPSLIDRCFEEFSPLEDGRNASLFLTGDMGSGKTTLLLQLFEELRENDLALVTVRCHPEAQTPYAAIRSIFNQLLSLESTPDRARDVLRSDAVQRVLRKAEEENPEGPAIALSGEIPSRFLMYEEVTNALKEIASEAPFGILVDDFHFTDMPTLGFWNYFLWDAREVPLIFVGTMNTEGEGIPGYNPAVRTMVDSLTGEDDVGEIGIPPLSERETGKLLGGMFKSGSTRKLLLPVIQDIAKGNPGITVDLLRRWIAEGILKASDGKIALKKGTGVKDLKSPSRLSLKGFHPLHLQTLQRLSLLSCDVNQDLLFFMIALSDAENAAILDALVHSGLVTERIELEGLSYTARKDLLPISEGGYPGMPDGREAHFILAQKLRDYSSQNDIDLSSEIARHFSLSNRPREGFPLYIDQARYSQNLFDYEGAVRYYRLVLETHRELPLVQAIEISNSVALNLFFLGEYRQALAFWTDNLEKLRLVKERIRDEIVTRIHIARCHRMLHQYDRAVECSERVREICAAHGITQYDIPIKLEEIRSLMRRGDIAIALENAQGCIQVLKDSNSEQEVTAHIILSYLYYLTNEYDNSIDTLNISLSIALRNNYPKLLATIYNNIGEIFLRRINLPLAEYYYKKSLDIKKALINNKGISDTFINLSKIEFIKGNLSKSLEYSHDALVLNRQLSDRIGRSRSYNNIAQIKLITGYFEEAFEYNKKSLDIREELNIPIYIALSKGLLAEYHLKTNNFNDSKKLFEQQLAIAEKYKARDMILTASAGISRCYLLRGNLKEAVDWAEKAITLCWEVGEKLEEGGILRLLGEISSAADQRKDAVKYFKDSEHVLKDIGMRYELGLTYLAWGTHYVKEDEVKKGKRRITPAREIFEEVGARFDLVKVHLVETRIAIESRKSEEAWQHYHSAVKINEEMGGPVDRKRFEECKRDILAGMVMVSTSEKSQFSLFSELSQLSACTRDIEKYFSRAVSLLLEKADADYGVLFIPGSRAASLHEIFLNRKGNLIRSNWLKNIYRDLLERVWDHETPSFHEIESFPPGRRSTKAIPPEVVLSIPLGIAEDNPSFLFIGYTSRMKARIQENIDAAVAGGNILGMIVRQSAMSRKLKDLEREKAFQIPEIIGASKKMKDVFRLISKAIQQENDHLSIVLMGDSGTGKELVAKAIHRLGPRSERRYVPINCASLVNNQPIESILFGHVKGAFTDAHENKKGLFEEADGGVLLLDDVDDLPIDTQARLLRVLQERQILPLGSNRYVKVDVKIICTSKKNLGQIVKEGGFRRDLFHRIQEIVIEIPSLRERKEDIPSLVSHFLQKHGGRDVTHRYSISPGAMECLQHFAWPGNVRELENAVKSAIFNADNLVIEETDLLPEIRSAAPISAPMVEEEREREECTLRESLNNFQKNLVTETLKHYGGNKTAAAKALGVTRIGFKKMLKRFESFDVEKEDD